MRKTLIIKKEIPVDFSVNNENHLYSFNLKEEILYKEEIRDGKIDSYWGRYEPIRITNEQIMWFDGSDGRWRYMSPEIQIAYKEYLAEKELL